MKLKAVKLLLELLHEDQLTETEWQAIYSGELDLKQGRGVSWRKIANMI